MTQMQRDEKEKKGRRQEEFTLCTLHASYTWKRIQNFFKIEDSKVLFKSKASPINRASTFFIRQNSEDSLRESLEKVQKGSEIVKNWEFKQFSLVIFLIQSVVFINLSPPSLSISLYSSTLCNQGIFSINKIFRFKYMCFNV